MKRTDEHAGAAPAGAAEPTAAAQERTEGPEPEVIRRLDALQDLFQRRLFEDRDKRRLIEDLSDRARAAEEGIALEYLAPFLMGVVRVIDRADTRIHTELGDGPDPGGERRRHLEFVDSLRSELLALLEQHRVAEISVHGPLDPTVHEVVEVRGERGDGRSTRIVELVQRGFRYGSRLLRPARVVVRVEGAGGGEAPR